VIILHGDNQVASRQHLTTLKQAATKLGKQITELAGEVSLELLMPAAESNSLFGSSNLVVIENLFSGRPSNDRKAVISYLLAKSGDVVVWEGKDVSGKIKDVDPQSTRRFDLPKYVFKFLDNLSITSLQLALSTAAPEQILALLASQIHKIILFKEGVASLPSWQLAKLKIQSSRFKIQDLIKLNRELLEIDYAQKTSAAPYDLATALEIFVVRLT